MDGFRREGLGVSLTARFCELWSKRVGVTKGVATMGTNRSTEECTTPRIGSRNIKIKIGGGGLPRNQK